MADGQAIQQIQDCFKSIHSTCQSINIEHAKGNTTVNAINKLHEKGRNDKLTQTNRQKLKSLYSQALNEAESEEALIKRALDKIHEIRAIKNERRIQAKNAGSKGMRRGALMKILQSSAQTLPLWIGKPGEKPPGLCGATPPDPSYVAKPFDMVAALVKGAEGDGDENWILAEVSHYREGKYEVIDIDEESVTDKLILSKNKVIPLPIMRANPHTDGDALFPKGTMVIALYPQTTCFYKAIINEPPAEINDDYEVLFEDSSYTEGVSPPLKIAQRFVILQPKEKKK